MTTFEIQDLKCLPQTNIFSLGIIKKKNLKKRRNYKKKMFLRSSERALLKQYLQIKDLI